MNAAINKSPSLWARLSRAGAGLALLCAGCLYTPSTAHGQLPSTLYSWQSAPNNIQEWKFAFGGGASATLTNSVAGELTIQETSPTIGASFAFSDGGNRVRETSQSNGGTDLTGLDWLEYEIGHNGSGPINVQFYTQAANGISGPSPNYAFTALGPDLAITPGVNTYRVPLTALPPDQLVYIREMGVQVREHAAMGNVTWTVREVRSGGTPLKIRNLITHPASNEGGLQGATVNFDNSGVLGNDGGQNQTGLSYNPAGTGSLQWTDVGTSVNASAAGAAITWGNGTPWAGNGFNLRTTDLSGYTEMVVRMSATGTPVGGTVGVQGFFNTNGFGFHTANGTAAALPIDGQFHDLKFDIAGIPGMSTTELTGINVFSHANNLVMNVDNIRFRNVAVAEHRLFSWENSLEGWVQGPDTGHVHSIVSQGATHGSTALQIDRRSVPGSGAEPADGPFVNGSSYTTMNASVIGDLTSRINDASVVAFDVTYKDFGGEFISPSSTNFYVSFNDHSGGLYQAATSNIDINGVNPPETVTLRIPVENFADPTMGSTKTLVADGLSTTATQFTITLATNTDGGAVYQIDNFRLLTEVVQDTADYNSDGLVNSVDYNDWKAAFAVNTVADGDGDGDSDGTDFLIWQRKFGGPAQVAAVGPVPEPASWLVGGIGAALVAAGRRRAASRRS